MQSSAPMCPLMCGSPATVVSDPNDGGYFWVSGCTCVRYRISGDVVAKIEEDSPAHNIRSILPRLRAAARRVALDVDAGKEPPEQLTPHIISQAGKRWLQITDALAAAEIAHNEGLLQSKGL